MAQSDDEKKRDEVLKRMLSTPPKPHDVKPERKRPDGPADKDVAPDGKGTRPRHQD